MLCQIFGEWWKNHILPQQGEENANMTYFNKSLKLCKAMIFENMTLTIERQQSKLIRMKLQSFDYMQSESVEDRALSCL